MTSNWVLLEKIGDEVNKFTDQRLVTELSELASKTKYRTGKKQASVKDLAKNALLVA